MLHLQMASMIVTQGKTNGLDQERVLALVSEFLLIVSCRSAPQGELGGPAFLLHWEKLLGSVSIRHFLCSGACSD